MIGSIMLNFVGGWTFKMTRTFQVLLIFSLLCFVFIRPGMFYYHKYQHCNYAVRVLFSFSIDLMFDMSLHNSNTIYFFHNFLFFTFTPSFRLFMKKIFLIIESSMCKVTQAFTIKIF